MAIVTVDQTFQCAVGLDLVKESSGSVEQAVVIAEGKGPGQGFRFTEIDGRFQFRIEAAIDGEFIGVGDGVLDELLPHQGQQFLDVLFAIGFPTQLRMVLFQFD